MREDLEDGSDEPIVYAYPGHVMGTRLYTPPEFFWDDPYIPEGLDIWALGVTLFEMLTGFRPYPDERSIKFGIIPYSPEDIVNLEALVEMWPILDDCFQLYPLARGSLQDLRNSGSILRFWEVTSWPLPRVHMCGVSIRSPTRDEID